MPCNQNYWSILLLCSITCGASATSILSWIDADGITHFSDSPPAIPVDGVTVIEMNDDYPPLPDAQGDYYSIANQWNRMREERDAKNKLNLEKARIRAEQSVALANAQRPSEQQNYGNHYPIYGFPRHHLNRGGTGFQDERRSALPRGPHHVQAGHGNLRRRAQSRGNGVAGGRRGHLQRGGGLSFGFSIQ